MPKKPTLYYHPGSPPARACVMVARDIDLDIELKLVNFVASEHTSEAYTEINPAQTVPALVDGDFVICDSHAICLYMIEKYGKNDYLYPKDNLALRTVINDRLFFDASFIFPRGLNVMRPVFMEGQSFVAEEKIRQIHRGYRVVESYLTSSKYIASNERMTLADIALFSWMETFTQLYTVEDYPRLKIWLRIMRKLPYYEELRYSAKKQVEFFRSALETNKNAALCRKK